MSFLPDFIRGLAAIGLVAASCSSVTGGSTPHADKADHWAWQPVRGDIRPPAVESVAGVAWANNAIDRFILAKLQGAGLVPSAPASRRTIVRRLYFDLTGLPPTPTDVEAFVKDSSPAAYVNLVEELLASPHFGERWGQHWLDLVRFSETRGHEGDYPIPEIGRAHV